MKLRLVAGLLLSVAVSWPVEAQDVSLRLARHRSDAVLREIAADLPAATTGGTQSGTPGAAGVDVSAKPRLRREITASIDARAGFDRQTVVFGNPGNPDVAGTAKRRIGSLNLSLSYPLSAQSSVFVSVPYIDQRETLNSSLGTASLRGRGLGDLGFYMQHRFPEIAKGTELSVSLGMIVPTGKDSFNLAPNELPTGVGFYQPVARVMLRKLRVPLQLYGAVDYGTSFSRNVGGSRLRLPNSYGGELGFYYAMGPELTSQTSVSVSKVTSPFVDARGATVGYLSQALTYQANQRTSLRASVDVGLTEDSTDAFAGLSINSNF